jgi:AAA domain
MIEDDPRIVRLVDKTPSKIEYLTGASLADEAKAPVYLINNVLETDAHGTLLGASQSFKSFMALSMAVSICTGTDFFGHTAFISGKVVYVCGEGFGALGRRIKAISVHSGLPLDNLYIVKTPITIDDRYLMDKLRGLINEISPALVIFDTFSSLVSEANEDKNAEVAKVLNLVRNTCRNGVTSSIIVHHYGKDESKGARGAYAFRANSDFEYVMARNNDGMNAILSCKKMKDGEFFKDIGVLAQIIDLDMVRQDGEKTTSLVMVSSDILASESKKRLSPRLSNILQALHDAINKFGEEPSREIKEKFAGFGATVVKKQVVSYEMWRLLAYKTIEIDRDTEACPAWSPESAANSKKKAFQRARDDLKTLNKIMTYDNYVWTIE